MKKFTFTIHDVREGTASQFDELYCLHCGHGGVLDFNALEITECDGKCEKCGKYQDPCLTQVWNGLEFVPCTDDQLCPRCEYFLEIA